MLIGTKQAKDIPAGSSVNPVYVGSINFADSFSNLSKYIYLSQHYDQATDQIIANCNITYGGWTINCQLPNGTTVTGNAYSVDGLFGSTFSNLRLVVYCTGTTSRLNTDLTTHIWLYRWAGSQSTDNIPIDVRLKSASQFVDSSKIYQHQMRFQGNALDANSNTVTVTGNMWWLGKQSTAYTNTTFLNFLKAGYVSSNTPIQCEAYDSTGNKIIYARSDTTSGVIFTIWDSVNNTTTTLTLSAFTAIADIVNSFIY